MEKRKTGEKKEKGQALLVAMIFLLALTFLGFGLITVATIDIHSARNMRLAEEVLTIAEEGALMSMAYASDSKNDFVNLPPGTTVNLASTSGFSIPHAGRATNDRLQYEVSLVMEGEVPCPAGSSAGTDPSGFTIICVQIRARSQGWVSDRSGVIFGAANKPKIHRTVEILARLKTAVQQ